MVPLGQFRWGPDGGDGGTLGEGDKMKRQIDKLTKRDIKGIKRFLGKEKGCPFARGLYKTYCYKCEAIFPKFIAHGWNHPCYDFNCSYVNRVARKVIKDWEAKHGRR